MDATDDGSPKLVLVYFLVAATIVTLSGLVVGAIISLHGEDQAGGFTGSWATWDPVLRCLQPGDCSQASKELVAAYTNRNACDGPGRRVCLVPLGAVEPSLFEHLVSYYEKQYGLNVRVLPPVSFNFVETRDHDGQVEARTLLFSIRRLYASLSYDQDAILIGLTSTDLFLTERPNWDWAFGQTFTSRWQGKDVRREAIISTYRMDPRAWGERANQKLYQTRVRKAINKYVGAMYYGLQFSDDPRNPSYTPMVSLDDLDRLDERIPVPK